MTIRFACAALMLGSCALPDYETVSKGTFTCGAFKQPDLLSDACTECVRTSCCDTAKSCGNDPECSTGFGQLITPVARVATAFEPMLSCMQSRCDAECEVSFGCEGKGYVPAAPAGDENHSYAFDLALREYPLVVSSASTEGLAVEACQNGNPNCKADATTAAHTDAQGQVSLRLGSAFGGFFSIVDPNQANPTGYPHQVLQLAQPLYRAEQPWTESIFNQTVVKGLVVQVAGKPYSPDASHLVFYVHNCLPMRFLSGSQTVAHAGAANAVVTLTSNVAGPTASPVYRQGAGFSATATHTDDTGAGGAANLEPGYWRVAATVTDKAGKTHSLSENALIPEGGGVGIIHLFPKDTP